tara:strand:+ start:911 stop:1450 length:540 start_codon:yes stop_codon:yes gene_type:complete
MKKNNLKDSILKALNSKEIPLISHEELFSKLKFDRKEIGLAIIELEKANQIAIFKPRTKDDTVKISLTQDGTIFINNTSYYKEYKKEQTNTFYKVADKSIAILGILTGIIFGINSCSTESKNNDLIKMVQKKDSIINYQNGNFEDFNQKFDSINTEIKSLKSTINELNDISKNKGVKTN